MSKDFKGTISVEILSIAFDENGEDPPLSTGILSLSQGDKKVSGDAEPRVIGTQGPRLGLVRNP